MIKIKNYLQFVFGWRDDKKRCIYAMLRWGAWSYLLIGSIIGMDIIAFLLCGTLCVGVENISQRGCSIAGW